MKKMWFIVLGILFLFTTSCVNNFTDSKNSKLSVELPNTLFRTVDTSIDSYKVLGKLIDSNNNIVQEIKENTSGSSIELLFNSIEVGLEVKVSVEIYSIINQVETLYANGESDLFTVKAGEQSVSLTLIKKEDGKQTTATGVIIGTALYSNGAGDNSGIIVCAKKIDANTTPNIELLTTLLTTTDVDGIATTNDKGEFTFTDLEEGTYSVFAKSTISAEKAVLQNVTVTNETETQISLTLTAVSNVSGSISISGTELKNNVIVFIPGTNYIAVTDSEGKFTINNIPVSDIEYTVCALYNNQVFEISSNVLLEVGKTTECETYEINPIVTPEIIEKSKYFSYYAAEDGIHFNGEFPYQANWRVEVLNDTTSTSIQCDINENRGWKLIEPLVEKDKNYQYTISYINLSANYTTVIKETIDVTAIGGIGEITLKNEPKLKAPVWENGYFILDCEVAPELDMNEEISNRIYNQEFSYAIVKGKSWDDTTTYIYEKNIGINKDNTTNYEVKIPNITDWGNNLSALLSGQTYFIFALNRVKIKGSGDWIFRFYRTSMMYNVEDKNPRKKVLTVYGYKREGEDAYPVYPLIYTDSTMTISGMEKSLSDQGIDISELKDKTNNFSAKEMTINDSDTISNTIIFPYTSISDYGSEIIEPPFIIQNDKYNFLKWNYTSQYNNSTSTTLTHTPNNVIVKDTDGTEYFVDFYYASIHFSGTYTVTFNYGTDPYGTTYDPKEVYISYNSNNASSWNNINLSWYNKDVDYCYIDYFTDEDKNILSPYTNSQIQISSNKIYTAHWTQSDSGNLGNCSFTYYPNKSAINLAGSKTDDYWNADTGTSSSILSGSKYSYDTLSLDFDIQIGSGLCYNNTNLTIISCGLYNTFSVGDYAFANCSKLTTVPFGRVQSIGDHAFEGCIALTEINIPDETGDTVTIGAKAFANCTNLKKITLGKCKAVDPTAFDGCSELVFEVTFTEKEKPTWWDTLLAHLTEKGITYTKITILNDQVEYSYDTATKTVVVSSRINPETGLEYDGITGDYYDGGNGSTSELAGITIDYSTITFNIKGIGSGLCLYNTNLETININKELDIGEGAFAYCGNLTSFNNPNSCFVDSIGILAFANCSKLVTFDFSYVKNIGNNAFYSCPSLTSATLSSIESIGSTAFQDCEALTEVIIPDETGDTVTIGTQAFCKCTNLKKITLGKCKEVDPTAFDECNDMDFTLLFTEKDAPDWWTNLKATLDKNGIIYTTTYQASIAN